MALRRFSSWWTVSTPNESLNVSPSLEHGGKPQDSVYSRRAKEENDATGGSSVSIRSEEGKRSDAEGQTVEEGVAHVVDDVGNPLVVIVDSQFKHLLLFAARRR